MPKSKKARLRTDHGRVGHSKKPRKMHTFSKLSTTLPLASPTLKQNSGKKNPSHLRPIVPFGKKDRILLIGEGDFSFAHSLVVQYRCKNVLATSYDSKEILHSKYPEAERHVQEILHGASRQSELDVGRMSNAELENGNQSQERGNGDEKHGEDEVKELAPGKPPQRRRPNVLFSVDARKLGHASGGGKDVRFGFPRRERKHLAWQEARKSNGGSLSPTPPKDGPWDLICFNFPHVGGLSTDVNRQVRANQELLVAFFKACLPLLSSRPAADGEHLEDKAAWDFSAESGFDSDEDDEEEGLAPLNAFGREKSGPRNEPGQIVVTLFEGEPYTLWNIKDLARHAGLRVVTSFKFPWASYKGYSHARTLGEVEGKHGGRGGWRGEDRQARMYMFEPREDHRVPTRGLQSSNMDNVARNKRSRASDSDDSD
ncbi:hypothetical protein BDV28DRAFT_84262 [Aspergillus coremiiformis]|uniref:25S rRNA (uridine-N(3))-methyltransferase BMT5-like domain-containing protein n=1 Tax=Aspergillus coremiiformis TaxID=138285 RepID=A0A5N6YU59_9EURO|nr:hypothetical protein BDV28DRAFT_84262 [Aspergillus coremiiformis]